MLSPQSCLGHGGGGSQRGGFEPQSMRAEHSGPIAGCSDRRVLVVREPTFRTDHHRDGRPAQFSGNWGPLTISQPARAGQRLSQKVR
jgi:hypothetical protein